MAFEQILIESLKNAFRIPVLIFLAFMLGYLILIRKEDIGKLSKFLIPAFIIGAIFQLSTYWTRIFQNFGFPILGRLSATRQPITGIVYWISSLSKLVVTIKLALIMKIILILIGIFMLLKYFKKDLELVQKIENFLMKKSTQIVLFILFILSFIRAYHPAIEMLTFREPTIAPHFLVALIYSIIFVLPFFIIYYLAKNYIPKKDSSIIVAGIIMLAIGVLALIF